MGFYIRKSIKFGPIRFNISKSGIGISSGVQGARISTGPRGTYINVGRSGVYYRRKIDETISSPTPSTKRDQFEEISNSNDELRTASINELLESSNQELITQINARIQQPTYALLIGLLSIFIAGGIALFAHILQQDITIIKLFLLFTSFAIGVVGLYLAWGTNQQEKLARITTLKYKLDEEATNELIKLQKVFNELTKASRIWRVTSRKATWDWKRNAGASSLITRNRITAGRLTPPFLNTRISVYGFSLGMMQLFFLPDQVFILQNGKYGAVSYNSLEVNAYPTRYIESEGVPNDSKILEYTWRYVRKDGGPDRRFSNNQQIPIVQYGQVELFSKSGMNLHFQVSNLSLAQEFTQALSHYINFRKESHHSSSNKPHSKSQEEQTKPYYTIKLTSAHKVLNVSDNSSKEEITSAYKKLAQQYHPDKVTGLAPEFRELAEKRMKEINAAYKELMATFKE